MSRLLMLSCAPIVCALAAAPLLRADLIDDLESLTPGPLPQGIWEDMSTRVAGHPDPSTCEVINTTDAFGAPTIAIQTKPILGGSTGFHTAAQFATVHDLTADVRVDTFGDGQAWPTTVGFTMDDGAPDINGSPQCLIYPWFDGNWYFFLNEPNGDIYLIITPPIVVGNWYTLNLRVDTSTGDINLLISDTATSQPLGGGLINIDFDRNYNRLSFFDGELPGTATTSAQATVDNIRYTATGVINPADLNADGNVDSTDLAILLANWGASGPADFTGDGVVDSSDLAVLLAAWG